MGTDSWLQLAIVQVLRDGNDAKFAAVQEFSDVFLGSNLRYTMTYRMTMNFV